MTSEKFGAVYTALTSVLASETVTIISDKYDLPETTSLSNLENSLLRITRGVLYKDARCVRWVKEYHEFLAHGQIPDNHPLASFFESIGGFRSRGSVDDSGLSDYPGVIRYISTCIKAFWKFESADFSADFDSVKQRIARSGFPSIDEYTAQRFRQILLRWIGKAPAHSTLIGRHGPGSVSTGEKGLKKWFMDSYPRGLDPIVFRFNSSHLNERPSSPFRFGITKCIAVPKDVRGPRYISCEPLELQFLQQSIRAELESRAIRSKCNVAFNDQVSHRNLLLTGKYVSIDLKDASDYVSRRLVMKVFPKGWLDLLRLSRSTFMQVESSMVPIRAFAPMGSALCFPVMSLVIAASLREAGITDYSVFGDDVLVRDDDYYTALHAIERIGLRINASKTCNRFFRESCGLDIVATPSGVVDVTPIYLRKSFTTRQGALQAGEKAIAFGRLGYVKVSTFLDSIADSYGFSLRRIHERSRWNRSYQCREYRLARPCGLAKKEVPTEWERLFRWFCEKSQSETVDSRSAFQPRIKYLWLSGHDTIVRELLA